MLFALNDSNANNTWSPLCPLINSSRGSDHHMVQHPPSSDDNNRSSSDEMSTECEVLSTEEVFSSEFPFVKNKRVIHSLLASAAVRFYFNICIIFKSVKLQISQHIKRQIINSICCNLLRLSSQVSCKILSPDCL